jgi:two-component sensor histidine kinase
MSPDGPAAEELETLRRRVADLEAEVVQCQAAVKAVHHRVKNHLQVICSLLHLQATQVADPAGRAALASSEGRVRALALVHEAGYRSPDPDRIDLGPHLEGLCAQLIHSPPVNLDRVRVTVQAGAARIDLDRAVSATLLAHELVGNALRHAFPDDRAGTVTVAMDQDPEGRYTLTVADDGVGLPEKLDIRQTRTLGLQLVTALAQQLGGTVSVDRAAGTTVRVTFPDRPLTGGAP